jgi:hypothetical protein
MNRGSLALAVVASCLIACGGGGATDDGGGGTPPPDTVLMTPGNAPTYGWNYGNADTVEVARSSDIFTPVWRTVASTLDGIPSGLMHGTTGADRTVPVNTESTLTSGISYRVRIVRQTGSSVVTKTFTVP